MWQAQCYAIHKKQICSVPTVTLEVDAITPLFLRRKLEFQGESPAPAPVEGKWFESVKFDSKDLPFCNCFEKLKPFLQLYLFINGLWFQHWGGWSIKKWMGGNCSQSFLRGLFLGYIRAPDGDSTRVRERETWVDQSFEELIPILYFPWSTFIHWDVMPKSRGVSSPAHRLWALPIPKGDCLGESDLKALTRRTWSFQRRKWARRKERVSYVMKGACD